MEDRELINKIRLLENIHPDKNWVNFCRQNLLEKFSPGFFPRFVFPRLVPAVITLSVIMLVGVGFLFEVKSTLPGDALYPTKIVLSKVKSNLKSNLAVVFKDGIKVRAKSEFAAARVNEVSKIAAVSPQDNEEEKMTQALENFKWGLIEVENSLTELEEADKPEAVLAAVSVTKRTEKFEKVLAGLNQSGNSPNIAEAQRCAKDLENKALTVIVSNDSEAESDFLQKLKTNIEERIAELEFSAEISEEAGKLIAKAQELLKSEVPADILEALEKVNQAEKIL